MSHELRYTRRAVKDIRKLAEITKKRIGKALLRYKEAPLEHAEKITGPNLGSYRFRVGDYRVVFDIEDNEIIVLRVGHRKEIYRRRSS